MCGALLPSVRVEMRLILIEYKKIKKPQITDGLKRIFFEKKKKKTTLRIANNLQHYDSLFRSARGGGCKSSIGNRYDFPVNLVKIEVVSQFWTGYSGHYVIPVC